jgi:GT2 family glycosyltransferase
MAEETISAVVVTYRTGPVLPACLRAILQNKRIVELIIVDNGNDAVGREFLDEFAAASPAVHLLRPGKNLGFAKGCNLGASQAAGDYVAIVNPDLMVPPDTFDKIVLAFHTYSNTWLCGAQLLNMDGTEQRGGRRDVLTPWRVLIESLRLDRLFPRHPHFRRLNMHQNPPPMAVVEVPTISGALMVLPRLRWLQLGGMDENIFLHLEDTDLCLRILKSGGRILYCGDTPVYHHLGTSDVPRIFIEWHKVRSAGYYFRKHFSTTYPRWALFVVSLALWGRFGAIALRALGKDARWFKCHWARYKDAAGDFLSNRVR